MADNLLPEDFYDEDQEMSVEDIEDEKYTGYKDSYYFEIEQGDFLRDGSNKVILCSGFDAWTQWCEKCLLTQRGSCLAYDTDFGIDAELAFAADSKEEAENILRTEITEALNADPFSRLDYIDEITFNWTAPDAVEIFAVIVGIDGNTAEISATLQTE